MEGGTRTITFASWYSATAARIFATRASWDSDGSRRYFQSDQATKQVAEFGAAVPSNNENPPRMNQFSTPGMSLNVAFSFSVTLRVRSRDAASGSWMGMMMYPWSSVG